MGLENLNSIFNEGLDLVGEDFQSGQPQHSNDSKIKHIGGSHLDNPILDALGRSSNSFVIGGVGVNNQPFRVQNFDPRIPKPQTTIVNINTYPGTIHKPTNPTDFSQAGIGGIPYTSLKELGLQLENSSGWESLYKKDHTPLNVENPSPLIPFKPYIYGGNVSRDNLKIRYNNENKFSSTNSLSRTNTLMLGSGTLGGGASAGEPYIVSEIGDTGREMNKGNRFLPFHRAQTDLARISKYLSSPQGTAQSVAKNVSLLVPTAVVNKSGKLTRHTQRFNTPWNPLNTLFNVGARAVGEGVPNTPWPSGGIGGVTNSYTGFVSSVNPTARVWDKIDGTDDNPFDNDRYKNFFGLNTPFKSITGDSTTLRDFKEYSDDLGNTDDQNNQLPFYFIDLRDNNIIYFRAYLEGITENLSPSWATTNYVGRSEPVYVYERSEREINFTLKLFAHTESELKMIRKKVNRLTSLCYPQYQKDQLLTATSGTVRMKPPLTKFRMGKTFGGQGSELVGFIKSLSYTVPEESPWDATHQQPKHLVVTINYQVIHERVPQMKDYDNETDYDFYEKIWS